MSCLTNTAAAAGMASKNAISPAANMAGGLAGQNKQIMVSDVRQGGGRYIVIRAEGQQRCQMIPLVGQTLDLPGPSQIVSTAEGVWWIKTQANINWAAKSDQKKDDKPTTVSIGQKTRLVSEAIRQKRQIQVDYRTVKGRQRYTLAPLDVRPGQKKYKDRRFLVGYSEADQRVRRLRLDRVTALEVTKNSFSPKAISAKAGLSEKTTSWHLPRQWGAKSRVSATKIMEQAGSQFETLDWQLEGNQVKILELDPGHRPRAARAVLERLKNAGYEITPDHPAENTLPFWQTMYDEGFIDVQPETLATREQGEIGR